MNLVELILASVFYAAGGLFMKLSAGLTRPAPALAFSTFFLGGACLQALGMRQRDLGMATILVLGVEAIMTLVFSLLVLGEGMSAQRAVAIALVLVGLGLLSQT
jgi:quaternary ammonium compound-resistance protein SugE